MKLPLKIAIVGCGGMGSGHARAISGRYDETPEFLSYDAWQRGSIVVSDLKGRLELIGVYDIDDEKMKWVAQMGWKCYKDYEDLLSDPEVDIVLVATPNHLHKDMVIQAMRAGKHVLCEKPVTITSADLEEIIAVAKETNRVFYPRQNRRWDYDYRLAKKIYDEKLVGDVFCIESSYYGSRGIPGDWRKVKEYGGGMMLDWGVHLLDRMLQLNKSKLSRVYCHLTQVTSDECDDGFDARLEFEDGMIAKVSVGTCHFINRPRWYVFGREGSAEIISSLGDGQMIRVTNWDEGYVKPVLSGEGLTKTMAPRDENSTEILELPQITIDRNALYENLVDTINGEAEQIVKPEEALRVLRLMEKLFESSEKDQVLPFEP